MQEPGLLVLAAGMGSRYGGLKQLEPMGPHGETLLDYSVYDAMQAGFRRIVFIIRKDIEAPFRTTIGKRYENRIEIDYAFQELDDLPDGFTMSLDGRSKPWGTAHALHSARNSVRGSFAVINADDFYGREAYLVVAEHFRQCAIAGEDPMCMVGYPLDHTLSMHGAVNRGLCQSQDGLLKSVAEVIDISTDREGTILGTAIDGSEIRLEPDALVSMNLWGFSDRIFGKLEEHLIYFLNRHDRALSAEFYIPTFVDDLIRIEDARCRLLQTTAKWFGVTYPGDRPFVQAHLQELVASNAYPSPLLT